MRHFNNIMKLIAATGYRPNFLTLKVTIKTTQLSIYFESLAGDILQCEFPYEQLLTNFSNELTEISKKVKYLEFTELITDLHDPEKIWRVIADSRIPLFRHVWFRGNDFTMEDVNKMLTRMNPTRLTLMPMSPNFCFKKSIVTQSPIPITILRVSRFEVTLAQFLHYPEIELQKTDFTDREINLVFRRWQRGHYPLLKKLVIRSNVTHLTFDGLMDKIDYIPTGVQEPNIYRKLVDKQTKVAYFRYTGNVVEFTVTGLEWDVELLGEALLYKTSLRQTAAYQNK